MIIPSEHLPKFQSYLHFLNQQFEILKSAPLEKTKALCYSDTLDELNSKLAKLCTIRNSSLPDLTSFDPDAETETVNKALSTTGLNISRSKLMIFESLILSIFGEGIDRYIKPAVEGMLHLNSKENSQAAVEIKLEKQAQALNQGYATLYLNFAWKVAQIVMLGSGIYYGGLSVVLTIPGILSMLPYLLSKKNYQIYCETLSAFRLAFAKAFLEFSGKYLIPGRIKNQLSQLQERFQDNVGKFERGELFAKLDFKIPAEMSGDLTVADSPKSYSYKLFKERILDSWKMPLELNSTPIEELFTWGLKPDNITKWIDETHLRLSLKEKCEAIRTLPLPGPGSYWENVTEIDKKLEELYSLSTELTNDRRVTHLYNSSLILALYRIEAIMYYLNCKDPTDGTHPIARNHKPDFTPLLIWYLSDQTVKNHEIREETEALLGYLLPEFNIEDDLSIDQIKTYGRSLLWNIEIDPLFLNAFASDEKLLRNRLQKLWKTVPPEEKYFCELIESAEGKTRFQGIPEEFKRIILRYESLNLEESDSLEEAIRRNAPIAPVPLVKENLSQAKTADELNPSKMTIPRRYRLMKLQTLICSKAILYDTSKGDLLQHLWTPENKATEDKTSEARSKAIG